MKMTNLYQNFDLNFLFSELPQNFFFEKKAVNSKKYSIRKICPNLQEIWNESASSTCLAFKFHQVLKDVNIFSESEKNSCKKDATKKEKQNTKVDCIRKINLYNRMRFIEPWLIRCLLEEFLTNWTYRVKRKPDAGKLKFFAQSSLDDENCVYALHVHVNRFDFFSHARYFLSAGSSCVMKSPSYYLTCAHFCLICILVFTNKHSSIFSRCLSTLNMTRVCN